VSYLVLARKYRPQTFEEVLNQDHVTQTLANAIGAGRLAHAVLFAGPRGTGKTTVARILAKAMNCKEGPTPTPCNRCRSCNEVTHGNASDVYEIDGASNNGVDQVRELRENARYLPAYSPHKIYIIDEVHMLSLAAFNALLKTLEEPPAHVLFIFATTEPNKIPATILSRCQRHDFRRIDTRAIVEHLERICSKEAVTIEPEALWVIAREASGGMRDALSLLDQVMVCAKGPILLDRVLDLLGVMNRKGIFDLSEAVLGKDAPAILELIHEAYSRGQDMKRLFFEVLEHFRNLLVAKNSKTPGRLMDLPAAEVEKITAQSQGVSAVYLSQLVDVLMKEESAIRFSTLPRIALEMVLINTLEVVPALPIETLVEKLDMLRKEVALLDVGDRGVPKVSHPHPAPAMQAEDSGAVSENAVSEGDPLPDTVRESVAAFSTGIDPWERVLHTLSEKNPSLAASLTKCRLVRRTESELEVEVHGNGYDFQALNRKKNKAALAKACESVYERAMTVYFVRPEETAAATPAKPKSKNDLKKEAIQHPLVAEAVRIFGGKVVDIKVF